MNARDTITIQAADKTYRVRFLGAGAAADLDPFVGAFEVAAEGAGEVRQLRVAMEGLKFLWTADAALDADRAAERIMRSVGLLAVEAHLAGRLAPDPSGTLQVRTLIGARYPDYTSVERFVGSLYDSPGRIQRLVREDVLECLADHADEKKNRNRSHRPRPHDPPHPCLARQATLLLGRRNPRRPARPRIGRPRRTPRRPLSPCPGVARRAKPDRPQRPGMSAANPGDSVTRAPFTFSRRACAARYHQASRP